MQGQTSFLNTFFFEFWLKLYFNDYWSEKTDKTRGSCKLYVHWCASSQHEPETDLILQITPSPFRVNCFIYTIF